MGFGVEDTRKKPQASLKELVDKGSITVGDATDWLRTIYEIRFFEEKVFDLLGQNIIKGASHLYAGEARPRLAAMVRSVAASRPGFMPATNSPRSACTGGMSWK